MNSTKGPSLAGREWLAGTFSAADILMADVLRLADRFDRLADYPACRGYVARATARPAIAKAHADQMAQFRRGGLSPAHEPTVAKPPSDPVEVWNGS
jgi:hypothetical protein